MQAPLYWIYNITISLPTPYLFTVMHLHKNPIESSVVKLQATLPTISSATQC